MIGLIEDGSCDLNIGDSDVTIMSMHIYILIFGLVELEYLDVGVRKIPDSADSAIV